MHARGSEYQLRRAEQGDVGFIPFALFDRTGYAAMAAERFATEGVRVEEVTADERGRTLLESLPAVFVGGGGSIPVAGLLKAELGLDTVFIGFGLDDDRVHSPNEKFNISNFYGGILARVAKSHIRIGTLQFFASVSDFDGLKILADHVIVANNS